MTASLWFDYAERVGEQPTQWPNNYRAVYLYHYVLEVSDGRVYTFSDYLKYGMQVDEEVTEDRIQNIVATLGAELQPDGVHLEEVSF